MEEYRQNSYRDYEKILRKVSITEDDKKDIKLHKRYINSNFAKYLPQNKEAEILDLGCGLGRYLSVLGEYGYTNCYGIDISPSNIEYCKSQNLNCECADVKVFLEDKEEKYDLIFFNEVIEHFTKTEVVEVLKYIHKSLKENGILIVKTINQANPFVGLSSRYIAFTHELGFVDISLDELLSGCGFRQIKIYGANIYVVFGLLGLICRILSKIIYGIHYLLCCFVGRSSVKVFEKDIIAVYRK